MTDTVSGVAQILEGNDDDARNALLRALSHSKTRRAVDLILQAAREPGVRAVPALRALQLAWPRVTDVAAVITLAEGLASDPEPLVREEAVNLLGVTAAAGVVDTLRRRLADDCPEVRLAAAFALERWREPAGVPVLLEGLEHPYLAAKAEAALSARFDVSRPASPAGWRDWLEARGLLPSPPEDR